MELSPQRGISGREGGLAVSHQTAESWTARRAESLVGVPHSGCAVGGDKNMAPIKRCTLIHPEQHHCLYIQFCSGNYVSYCGNELVMTIIM